MHFGDLVLLRVRPTRGPDLWVLREAAAMCDVWASLRDSDTEGELLHIDLDFEPALLRRVMERMDELYLATQRGEAAEVRRKACAAALNKAELPELMDVVLWFGHEELIIVVQEKLAALANELTTPATIRACFNITDDYLTSSDERAALQAPLLSPSAEEKAAAATAPLLSPSALAFTAPPAPPAPSRSLSKRARTEDASQACLGRCSGATLRMMLGVSRSWARRARTVAASADWLEATLVGGEGEARTAEIGWALAHGDDLQKLLRRLPAVARLQARGEHAELEPLLSAQVCDAQLLDAVPRPLRYAAALYTVMKSSMLTTIGECAFSGCSSLASISLPEGLTTIGKRAFMGCSYLASISLPEGLTTIGKAAFDGCSSLASISLPDGLTTIGGGAFIGCSSLASISLPDGLTTIGKRAFMGCSSLASISLPEGLTTIGRYAFRGCSSLASIILPDGLNTIDGGVFYGCSSLASISLPKGLTIIGEHAFYGCSSLASISLPLPEGLATIRGYAFSGCSSLFVPTLSLLLNGTDVAEGAFIGCLPAITTTTPAAITTTTPAAITTTTPFTRAASTLRLRPLCVDGRTAIELQLTPGHEVLLGRSSATTPNTFGICDPLVSRKHVHLVVEAAGTVNVKAVGSNPIQVTCAAGDEAGRTIKQLTKGKSASIRAGDQLQLVCEETVRELQGGNPSAWSGNLCCYAVELLDSVAASSLQAMLDVTDDSSALRSPAEQLPSPAKQPRLATIEAVPSRLSVSSQAAGQPSGVVANPMAPALLPGEPIAAAPSAYGSSQQHPAVAAAAAVAVPAVPTASTVPAAHAAPAPPPGVTAAAPASTSTVASVAPATISSALFADSAVPSAHVRAAPAGASVATAIEI